VAARRENVPLSSPCQGHAINDILGFRISGFDLDQTT
jgi:hypothetical protein